MKTWHWVAIGFGVLVLGGIVYFAMKSSGPAAELPAGGGGGGDSTAAGLVGTIGAGLTSIGTAIAGAATRPSESEAAAS